MKSVVVILVHYNNFDDTNACVESLLQSKEIDLKIIIVDNSQPNDTRLTAFDQLDNLHVISNRENIGFGRANNVGIKYALEAYELDHLLILNNDTIVPEQSIKTLIDQFDHTPNIGIATCRINYFDDREKVWYGGGEVDYTKGWPVIADLNSYGTENGAEKSRPITFSSGCVMMFSKESIDKIGGFDSDFFMYVEDLELSIRCLRAGYSIWYTSDAIIYHKVHGSAEIESPFRGLHPKNPKIAFQYYHKKRNQWITFYKHLEGAAYKRFNRNFWLNFYLKTVKLLILSPYRKDLWKACRKVRKEIRQYRNEHKK